MKGGDPLTELSTAYDLAATLGIPEEKIDALMAVRYPAPEEQLEALEAHGAIATTRAVARSYQAELLSCLRAGFPSRHFEAVLERMDSAFDQSYRPVKWRRAYVVRFVLVSETEVTVRERRSWSNLFGLRPRSEGHEMKREETTLATIAVGNELLSHDGGSFGRTPAAPSYHRGDRICIVVTVASAVFLKLCSAPLEVLRARFEKHNGVALHDVVYDYVIE